MARGGRKLAELLEKLDLIVEVRDARAPFSTSAPLVASFARVKPVVLVLAKKDLADPERTQIWIRDLELGRREVWALDLRKERPSALRKALSARKPGHRELRLAVMGIPNVGKSMLLNALAGKAQARVGGIPGLTREVSWYRSGDLLIVDSPGILDPHAEPGAHRVLSWLGCAKAEVLGGFESSALEFIRFLRVRGLFGPLLKKWEIEERDETEDRTLERLGRRLGCLVSGGEVDRELAGRRLLDAFSSGKLGAATLELPGDPLWGDGSSQDTP